MPTPSLRPPAEPLHKRLRRLREARGLRQRDLAKKLGRSQAYVSNAERGERRLDVIELHQWLTALGEGFMEFVRQIDDELRTTVARPEPPLAGPKAQQRKQRSSPLDTLRVIEAMRELVVQVHSKPERVDA